MILLKRNHWKKGTKEVIKRPKQWIRRKKKSKSSKSNEVRGKNSIHPEKLPTLMKPTQHLGVHRLDSRERNGWGYSTLQWGLSGYSIWTQVQYLTKSMKLFMEKDGFRLLLVTCIRKLKKERKQIKAEAAFALAG